MIEKGTLEKDIWWELRGFRESNQTDDDLFDLLKLVFEQGYHAGVLDYKDRDYEC